MNDQRIEDASLEQLEWLHANVNCIAPMALDGWVKWANGESSWPHGIDYMIETITMYPAEGTKIQFKRR